jgi:hypothetical protein
LLGGRDILMHKGLGVDESVMWGDYFFVETVTKALHFLAA